MCMAETTMCSLKSTYLFSKSHFPAFICSYVWPCDWVLYNGMWFLYRSHMYYFLDQPIKTFHVPYSLLFATSSFLEWNKSGVAWRAPLWGWWNWWRWVTLWITFWKQPLKNSTIAPCHEPEIYLIMLGHWDFSIFSYYSSLGIYPN